MSLTNLQTFYLSIKYRSYHFNREAVSVSVQVVLPDVHDVISSVGAFIAARISSGGCSTHGASGVFFWINTAGFWNITADLGKYVVIFIVWLARVYLMFLVATRNILNIGKTPDKDIV